mmetsp:Transcript_85449/g.174332  ORF Transcript_85449/g.174332 Transcript_85449/m.174332 type:complete len:85 (+) Transcript_85449:864-1118(+)
MLQILYHIFRCAAGQIPSVLMTRFKATTTLGWKCGSRRVTTSITSCAIIVNVLVSLILKTFLAPMALVFRKQRWCLIITATGMS